MGGWETHFYQVEDMVYFVGGKQLNFISLVGLSPPGLLPPIERYCAIVTADQADIALGLGAALWEIIQ